LSCTKANAILWQIKEKAPFFILSAVFSVITIRAQRVLFVSTFPLSARIANAPVSFAAYLEKFSGLMIWPFFILFRINSRHGRSSDRLY